jgi:site-specific DNA-methyltransferase (adenine-specific)
MYTPDSIINADCLSAFTGIDDNTFDMSFADPPFNLEKGYATYKDNLEDGDYLDWCVQWMEQMIRVTKKGGSIFLHNIPKWLADYHCKLKGKGVEFKHWIAWDAPTAPMGHSLQPAHYGILYYVKTGGKPKVYELRMPHKRCRDKKGCGLVLQDEEENGCGLLLKDYGGKKHTIHPFGPLVSDVWSDIHRCKHGRSRDDHPCQLPVHLLERLILLCTDAEDTVFDPFMGTGTTAVAAKRLGRHFYGSELSKKYHEICNKNLANETLESKLGTIWASCYLKRLHTVRDCDIGKEKAWRQEWKDLFEKWPDTNDERRALNTADLKFTKPISDKIKKLCVSKKELDKGVSNDDRTDHN